jgi:hypothetical protein
VIGVSVSSRRRFAWLADEFHATRHARSDGCVREVAFVVPANASAEVSITAIDKRRAMGETLARRRGDANVAWASVAGMSPELVFDQRALCRVLDNRMVRQPLDDFVITMRWR